MKKSLLACALVIVSGTPFVFTDVVPYLLSNYGYVSRVIDGDTIELNYGEGVRLAGLQTPERGEKNYDEATKDLKRLLIIPYVRIWRSGQKSHGRSIAVVYTVFGTQVNALMRGRYKSKKYDRLLTKEQRAELEKGGWK